MASKSRKVQDPDYEGGKRKKGKAGKDPNAPKRPLSAFFCFSNEERSKVKAKFPDYTVGQVAKELGERWKNCMNKPKFEALAAKEKQRYDEEMTEYKQNGSGAKKGPSKPVVTTKAAASAKVPAGKAKPGPKGSKPPLKKAKVDDDDEEGDEDVDEEEDEEEESD